MKKQTQKTEAERQATRDYMRIAKRKFDDKAVSIDEQLDEALSKIDWKRRAEAEKSFPLWVNTYMVPLMLNDPPPAKGVQVLEEMEKAVTSHANYLLCLPRGTGKSSWAECLALYCLATGLHRYVVVISNNARAANGLMQDVWRGIAETDTPFAQDYPAVCCPFHLLNGSFRRKQTYRGRTTDVQKNSSQIVLPRLAKDDGTEFESSGSILTCRGVSGGLRGMKFGKLRPSFVILDDLQDSESAQNPEQVKKLIDAIKKDIIPLGGKERISLLQLATPIAPEDLVEQLKNDKAWKTTTFKAIEKFPKNMDLWQAYFKVYDAECVADEPHDRSLKFYKSHRAEMDEGAEVFSPDRYSPKDGHISGLQKLLELQHTIGEAAFASEYQMQPKRMSFAVDVTPKNVVAKATSHPRMSVPEQYTFIAASTDLNLSYALTTAVVAFKPDMTAHVLHYFFTKSHVDMKLPAAEFSQEVFKVLGIVGQSLQQLGIPIQAWGIDASGTPFDAVCAFAKTASSRYAVPACPMLGRASHVFNAFVKSRLREAINSTVLCGTPEEHVKAGAGWKYMFWNSDLYRELVHKAVLAPVGASGSLTLFAGDAEEHSEFATQLTNEKLLFIRHCQNGKDIYTWKTKEPHDMLDVVAQAFAAAASQGISGVKRAGIRRPVVVKKPRIRIV